MDEIKRNARLCPELSIQTSILPDETSNVGFTVFLRSDPGFTVLDSNACGCHFLVSVCCQLLWYLARQIVRRLCGKRSAPDLILVQTWASAPPYAKSDRVQCVGVEEVGLIQVF